MPTVQRIQYDKYGGPELMRLENFEPPSPGKREVLVRVRAASANPMDWKVRNGDTKFMTAGGFREDWVTTSPGSSRRSAKRSPGFTLVRLCWGR